jgi:hypothetical protein
MIAVAAAEAPDYPFANILLGGLPLLVLIENVGQQFFLIANAQSDRHTLQDHCAAAESFDDKTDSLEKRQNLHEHRKIFMRQIDGFGEQQLLTGAGFFLQVLFCPLVQNALVRHM